MKEEQYLRAVEINKRIEELSETKRELRQNHMHKLSFSSCLNDITDVYQMCPDWVIDPIKAILAKHYKMILQEISDEINSLKKEIETL